MIAYLRSVTLFLGLNLLIIPHILTGQSRWSLGLEVNPRIVFFDHGETGNGLSTSPLLSIPVYGLTVGYNINSFTTLQTGILSNRYFHSYKIEGEFSPSFSEALTAIQIPLRLNYKINLKGEKLKWVSNLGINLGINRDFGTYESGSRSFFRGDGSRLLSTEYEAKNDLRKVFFLIETGMGFEIKLNRSNNLYIGVNYLTGLNRIIELDVLYTLSNDHQEAGQVFSNGSYYGYVFRYSFLLSNNKNKRAHNE